MKIARTILACALVLAAPTLNAFDDAVADHFGSLFLTPCRKPSTTTRERVDIPLPSGMTASILRIESEDPWCTGGFLEVRTPDRVFIGFPWPLDPKDGPIEKRIESYAWSKMKQTVRVDVTRTENAQGLYPARAWQITESGRIPMGGFVDPKGSMFFPGNFFDPMKDPGETRLRMIGPALALAPTQGNPGSKIHVIEFSDFQCPSCKRVSEPVSKVIEKYRDRVVYHRIDYPLFMNHPWALPAALMGRAIWKQNHEAFWEFKKAVYENQDTLNTFALPEFARGFAEDHGLDLKRYDADVQNAEVRNEILSAVGLAMELQVHATPTFWLNGHPVQVGDDGRDLEKALESALATR